AIHRTGKSVHREPQLAAVVPEPDEGRGRGTSERLDAREIDGGFDARVVAGCGEAGKSIDRNVDLALAHVRLKRGHQPSVGKQRRENATGKVSKLIQRALRLRGQAVQRLRGARRILYQQLFRIAQLGPDRLKPALAAR